jgi:hypothetical protein
VLTDQAELANIRKRACRVNRIQLTDQAELANIRKCRVNGLTGANGSKAELAEHQEVQGQAITVVLTDQAGP